MKDKKEWAERLRSTENVVLTMFGVPKKYRGMSFETFRGNDDLVKLCSEYAEVGLVLQGNAGVGKTHLAVSILRSKIEPEEFPTNRKLQKASFVTVPKLLLEIRNSFRDDNEGRSEKQIVDYYSEVQFLILDDLGSEKSTEFAVATLYIIIDRRDSEMMDTVITTNLTLDEIERKLSARIASRMAGMKNVTIKMDDYRKKR